MKHDNKPLRAEELQHMANKPYWHVGLRKHSVPPHWVILDTLIARNPEDYEYGKSWLAYAYQPIDFNEWEPCAKCRSCFSCTHVVEAINDSKNACFWCEHMDKFKPMNFCPNCGRPLTSESRKMFENRLIK